MHRPRPQPPAPQQRGKAQHWSGGKGAQNQPPVEVLEQQYIAQVDVLYESFMDPMKPSAAVRAESERVLALRDRVLTAAGMIDSTNPIPVVKPLQVPIVRASASAQKRTASGAPPVGKGGASRGPLNQPPPPVQLPPPDISQVNWKGHLHGALSRMYKGSGCKGAFQYEVVEQDDSSFTCTLTIYAAVIAAALEGVAPGNDTQEAATAAIEEASAGGRHHDQVMVFEAEETASSKKAAEQNAALAALQFLCPEVHQQVVTGMAQQGSAPKRPRTTSSGVQLPETYPDNDCKSRLNRFLTMLVGRPILRGDTIYETVNAEGVDYGPGPFQTTVHLLALGQGIAYAGEQSDTKKAAELSAAKIACDALEPDVAPLEQTRLEAKAEKKKKEMEARKAKMVDKEEDDLDEADALQE